MTERPHGLQPEFSKIVPLDRLGSTPALYVVEADGATRAALAERLGLLSLEHLSARLELWRAGKGAGASGSFTAEVIQECVVSTLPVASRIEAPMELRFEPIAEVGGEIELEAEELDLLPVENGAVDIGEAVVQSLALALDPYPRASAEDMAEARSRLMSEEEAAAQEQADRMARSPFAGLKRS